MRTCGLDIHFIVIDQQNRYNVLINRTRPLHSIYTLCYMRGWNIWFHWYCWSINDILITNRFYVRSTFIMQSISTYRTFVNYGSISEKKKQHFIVCVGNALGLSHTYFQLTVMNKQKQNFNAYPTINYYCKICCPIEPFC